MRLGLQEEHFSPIWNVGGGPYRYKEEPFTREVFLFLVQKEQRLERKRTKGLAGLGYALCFSVRNSVCLLQRERGSFKPSPFKQQRKARVLAGASVLGASCTRSPRESPSSRAAPAPALLGDTGKLFIIQESFLLLGEHSEAARGHTDTQEACLRQQHHKQKYRRRHRQGDTGCSRVQAASH